MNSFSSNKTLPTRKMRTLRCSMSTGTTEQKVGTPPMTSILSRHSRRPGPTSMIRFETLSKFSISSLGIDRRNSSLNLDLFHFKHKIILHLQNGTCFQKAGRAVRDCMIGCCHDCKAMDKVIFVFHLFLMFVGFAIATVSTISKMTTHNQCYLKALYNPDGSMV